MTSKFTRSSFASNNAINTDVQKRRFAAFARRLWQTLGDLKINVRKVVLIVGALLVVGTGIAVFYTATRPTMHFDYAAARVEAERLVMLRCQMPHCDPKLLTGPKEDHPVGSGWSFEWTYQGKPRYMHGVRVTEGGEINQYGGDPDDPDSAAYEQP